MCRLSSAIWLLDSALCRTFQLCMHAGFHSACDQVVSQDVLAVVDKDLPRFNAVNLATAVSRMAKQQAAPDAIMHAAVQPAFTRLKTAISALHRCINPCDLPTALAGLPARMSHISCAAHRQCCRQEGCMGLRTALCCTRTILVEGAPPVPGCAASRAGELSARCTSNIVHGFAAMGHHPGDVLLEACAVQAAARMCEANLQSVSNTLWGFATLRHKPGDALLRASEAAIVARCSRPARDVAPTAVVRCCEGKRGVTCTGEPADSSGSQGASQGLMQERICCKARSDLNVLLPCSISASMQAPALRDVYVTQYKIVGCGVSMSVRQARTCACRACCCGRTPRWRRAWTEPAWQPWQQRRRGSCRAWTRST